MATTIYRSLGTVNDLIEGFNWPIDFVLPESLQEFLDSIYVIDYSLSAVPGGEKATIWLAFEGERSLALPGLDGVRIVALGGDVEGLTFLTATLEVGDVKKFSLESLRFSLRFDDDILKPAALNEGDVVAQFAEIRVEGTISINSDFDVAIEGFDAFELTPAMIGDSGVIIAAKNVKLDLSRTSAIPEVIAAGFDESFMGVFIGEAQVKLPEGLPALAPEDLILRNAAIGSGGVSGRLTASYTPAYDAATKTFSGTGASAIFGIPFGLQEVSIEFKQNAFVEASLTGQMLMPFFDEPVSVAVGLSLDGSFTVRLTDTGSDGLYTFTKPDLLEARLESIGFEVVDGVVAAKVSGALKPLFGGFDWPSFEVRELAIDAHGNVRLEGGWLDLRDQYSLDFHGFQIEITKLGFGKTDDGAGRFIGLSGGLKLVDGMSAGASVEGLRLTWYDDGDVSISLDGVGVEFDIPDVLRFKGAVSYRELPGDVHRFDGDITLELITLDMRIDAQLVIGTAGTGIERYTFMAIYLGVELPAGIPLGATGLALYGMAGLFALEMQPDKHPDEAWFENDSGSPGWYLRPTEGVSDLSSKWAPQKGSLALGAGVTLGTLSDNGFTFSGKLLLVIVFPGPVLLIEGRANILKERAKLGEQAIFRALAVLDGREGTFLLNLAAEYKHGSGAELIDIRGSVEAFFDFSDAGAWHLYLGEKEPRERRIRAEIFQLFEANSYFMLEARQLAMGAWVGYDKKWKFGPLKVTVEAWIEGNVVVSWKPVYLHGDLWLHGQAGLKVFGFGLTLGVDALFAADVFDPFHLLASFTVKIGLPWPLSDIKKTIELEWGPDGDVPPLPMPLKEIAVEHFKTTTSWPLPRGSFLAPDHDPDGDGFLNEGAVTAADLAAFEAMFPPAAAPVVPLDCRPHITFGRAVHDRPLVGTNANFVVPARERIGDPALNEGPLEVEYALRSIELHTFDGSGWTLLARRSDTDPAIGDLYGSWAPVAGAGTGGVAQVKLWLWSKSAFDYTRHGGSAWDEWFTDEFDEYPCVPRPPDRVVCCDFEAVAVGQVLSPPYACGSGGKISISWRYPPQVPVTALDAPVETFGHAVCFPALIQGRDGASKPNRIDISLREPAKSVRILIVDSTAGSFGAGAASEVTATGHTGDGHIVGPIAPVAGVIVIPGPGLVRVVLAGAVCLVRVCVNIGPDPELVELQEEMAQHLRDEMARWSQQGDVLEPHTDYRIKVVTHIAASGIATKDLDVTEYAYFRTEGPPGLVSLSVPVGRDAATFDSGLNDLARYVEQTVPATVPAAGDKPTMARPVYRAYDVGVRFNENYVDLMYRIAGRDLGLYLFDNNNRPVRDVAGRLIVLPNRWGVTETLTLSESDDYWVTTVNGSDCAVIDTSVIPHSNTLTAANDGQVLNASTVYEARLIPLLLHETFDGLLGEVAAGTGAALGRWIVLDEGANMPPSHWETREDGTPPSRYVIQTSNIWGGTTDGRDPVKPGTLLVYSDTPALPPDHPEQPSNWTDYRVTVYVRSEDDDAVGVVCRYADAGRHYRFVMDRERRYRRLLKVYDGITTVLAEDEFTYTVDRDYAVTIEAYGASLRVYQDGALVFDAIDESMREGTIGLYCWANVGARFSDVRVDDFSTAAPAVYRFGFTTSLFTSFFHHLHSYRDDTWRTVLTDDAAVSAAVAATVVSAVPVSLDETRAFDDVARLAGLTTLPNPAEVGITRLELGAGSGDTTPFALLVEASEPIDWSRTTIEMSRATRPGVATVTPGDAKLTDVTFGAAEANEESVTVLLRTAADLNDFRLEHKTLSTVFARGGSDRVLLSDEFDGPAAGRLFLEEFGPNALDHYTIVDEGTASGPSVWSVTAGAIVQSSNIYGGNTSAASPEKPGTLALVDASDGWGDVRVRLRFSSGDDDAVGMVFRYRDADNYYRVSFDRERSYRRLIKKAAGTVTVLWEDAGAYNLGQSYTLVVDAFGDQLVAHLDGVMLFNLRDGDMAGGRIGLYCWANTQSRFEALDVESLSANPVLFDFAFTGLDEIEIVDEPGAAVGPSQWRAAAGVLTQTSGIAAPEAGAHFPGTYARAGEPRWRDVQISARLRSDDDGAIGIMFRYVDGDNYYRFSMDADRSYRRLIRTVAGVVTTLWQDASAYTVGQDYEVTIRVEGASLRGDLDGAPLFAVSDRHLSEGRIAFYCSNNTGAHFERVMVTDATRRIGAWTVADDGAASAPSIWTLGGGAVLQESSIGDDVAPEYPGSVALGADGPWTDCRVTATMRADANGAIGLIFRYVDAANYYRLSFDHQHNVRTLVRKHEGAVTVLWQAAGSYAIGADFSVTVDAVGSHLVAYLGSERLFEVVDTAHGRGRIALYAWQNAGARFERVEVRQPPLEARAMLTDRFAEGDISGWTVVDEGTLSAPSAWSAVDGALRQTSNIFEPPIDRDTLSKRATQAVGGDPAWTDVIITARLQSFDDDAIGVLFRYADAANFYRFSMDAERGYRRLVKSVAGVFTLLWEDAVAYEVGRSYELTVTLAGGTLRAYLDGLPLFVVEDGDVPAGGIGLYCWGNADARFSRVRVFPLDLAFDNWLLDERFDGPDASRWTFVDDGTVDGPSDWQVSGGWLRQTSGIQDGNASAAAPEKRGTVAVRGERSWSDYRLTVRLASGEDDAIGVMFRYLDADNYYRFSMDSQRAYRRLIKRIGGAVTTLWEDAVPFEVGREYLITIDCAGERLSGYVDGVRLFALDDSDLGSGQVGLYCWGNVDARFREVRAAAAAWETYYTFAGRKLLAAGTRVQVLSGNESAAPPLANPAHLVRRFAATLSDRGTIRFPAAAAELRLVGSAPGVVHERRFLADGEYQPVADVRVLRKADGTAFMVVLPAAEAPGSLLVPAEHRLRLTYRRDNQAADPDSLVLSEAGVTADEIVTLDVPWITH
jgi:hypothetical protein